MYDLPVVHPAAHRRIEREVQNLDQHFAVRRLADGFLGAAASRWRFGMPTGRAARRNWRLTTARAWLIVIRDRVLYTLRTRVPEAKA